MNAICQTDHSPGGSREWWTEPAAVSDDLTRALARFRGIVATLSSRLGRLGRLAGIPRRGDKGIRCGSPAGVALASALSAICESPPSAPSPALAPIAASRSASADRFGPALPPQPPDLRGALEDSSRKGSAEKSQTYKGKLLKSRFGGVMRLRLARGSRLFGT